MFPSKSLLALMTLAISFAGVSAGPVPASGHVSLPFKRNMKLTSLAEIVKSDKARAKAMKSTSGGPSKRDASIIVTNSAVDYTAQIGVGSPATMYTLLIDTGSSNTWVGAGQKYVKTSTSVSTGKSVRVSYGSGSFEGTEFTDTVNLGSGLTINKQSIGVASTSSGFNGVDGILGIGPADLTSGTVAGVDTVPTVTDNLFSQGTISDDTIGISFEPTDIQGLPNGELTFGTTDASKYTSEITYVPITAVSPASGYWGIDQSITYGSTNILDSTAGIVDTGTTLILLATDAFNAYQKATGGVMDSNTGLLKLTPDQYNNLKPLNFKVGASTYILSPNGQIFSRALNSALGGEAGGIYLVVSDIGSKSGSGLDFINGYTFLERFYSVYDTTNKRVGLATTPFTNAETN